MTFDSTLALLCVSAGVAGGILLAWLEVFQRHQTLIIMVTLAAFVAACVLGDDLSVLPNPTLRALSSLGVHFAPLVALPFIGAWLLTFLGRRFLADARAYFDEQAGSKPDVDEKRD